MNEKSTGAMTEPTPEDLRQAEFLREAARKISAEIGRLIVGQADVVE